MSNIRYHPHAVKLVLQLSLFMETLGMNQMV